MKMSNMHAIKAVNSPRFNLKIAKKKGIYTFILTFYKFSC